MVYILKRLPFLLILSLVLAACSTTSTPQARETAPYYVASVDIDATTSQAALEKMYGGNAIVFKPEAGFAVLGFSKEAGELTTLETSVSGDALSSPELSAAGQASWASGFSAWAGGFSAWAGGFSAWAGGWSAWAGGSTIPAPPAGNETLWQQIKLHEANQVAVNFGAGVKVAILDTGIDLNHPAFAGRLAPSSQWKDFVSNDNNPQEVGTSSDKGYGHGTAVAGIVAQIAPKATLLPIRVLDKDGKGDLDDVIAAIDWAIAQGADIINLSLGTYDYYAPLDHMVNYAAEHKVILVASSGNDGSETMTHPARMSWWQDRPVFSYMYGIGSVGSNNVRSPFSNYGSTISQAPGENIVTTYPGNQLTKASGTSFAAPVFTGALALALSDYPYDPASLFIYMGNTGQWPSGYEGTAYGLIDANAILRTAQGNAGYSLIGEGWLNNFTHWDWHTDNAAITTNGRSGWQNTGLEITGRGGTGQWIEGLRPNTTYTVSGYLRVSGPNASASIGAKSYGGANVYTTVYSTDWTYTELSFTTGPTDTRVEIVIWNNVENTKGFGDDLWVGRK